MAEGRGREPLRGRDDLGFEQGHGLRQQTCRIAVDSPYPRVVEFAGQEGGPGELEPKSEVDTEIAKVGGRGVRAAQPPTPRRWPRCRSRECRRPATRHRARAPTTSALPPTALCGPRARSRS